MKRTIVYCALFLSMLGMAYIPTDAPVDIADCVANRCAPAPVDGMSLAWILCTTVAIGITAWLHTQDR